MAKMPSNSDKKGRVAKSFLPKWNRAAAVSHNKSQRRYDYGKDNFLPNQLLKAIEASVTATSCRARKSEFIEGNGLSDQAIADLMINPKQTADDLIMEVADVVSIFEAYSLVVKYNNVGEPANIYVIPFELVRKNDDGTYYYNAKLVEQKDKKADRITYFQFNPNETPSSRLSRVDRQIALHGEQIGDIVYIYNKRSGQKEYPIPVSWAAMEEVEADAALGKMDWRNVKKGFRPDAILTTIGKMDDQEEDESGLTEQDAFDKEMSRFTGENAAPIMHMEVASADQKPQLDTFSQEKILNSTTEAADRVGRRVCRGMEVPEVLVPGFAKQGQLGNVQEVKNILRMYQKTIGKKQRLIERGLSIVFPDVDWTIEPLELLDELPDWVQDVMTLPEKRDLAGLEPLESSANQVAEALGTISPLVATKVLERMTDTEIRGIVDLPERDEPESNPEQGDL